MAQFNNTADKIALTGLGASLCASDNQVCIGNRPHLVPKPTKIKAKARYMSIGFKPAAC